MAFLTPCYDLIKRAIVIQKIMHSSFSVMQKIISSPPFRLSPLNLSVSEVGYRSLPCLYTIIFRV